MMRRGVQALGGVGAGLLVFATMPPLDLGPLVFVALVPLFWGAFGRGTPAGQAGGVRTVPTVPSVPTVPQVATVPTACTVATVPTLPRVPTTVAGSAHGPDGSEGRAETPAGRSRRTERPFLSGYLAGVVFFGLHLKWLLELSKEEVTIPWIMIPALLVVAGYLALSFAIPVVLSSWVRGRTGLSPAWTLPLFWTLFDFLRGVGPTAFSWGSVGYALSPWPVLIQGTAWAGFWILPGWILLVNGLFWEGLSRPRGGLWISAAFLAVALPAAAGALILARAPESVWVGAVSSGATLLPDGSRTAAVGDSGAVGGLRAEPHRSGSRNLGPSDLGGGERGRPTGSVRFGVIQANTPREIKWNPEYRTLVVQDLVDKTYQIAREQSPDLIVWPETAAPLRILWEPSLRELVETCAAETGRYTLAGTLDAAKVQDEWEHYNSAILFGPTGVALQRYHKRRMVPFGELTPFREQIPLLAKADFGQSEFTPGREPGRFPIPGVGEVSCLICFESTFPALARKDVAAGAEFLVNITNDFWFGPGAGPLQHARFANLRACETRTPLIRCGNTGISCVIDPYGRVRGATELFETSLLSFDVLPGKGGGLYVRFGDWILWLYTALALLLLCASAFRLRLSGRRLRF